MTSVSESSRNTDAMMPTTSSFKTRRIEDDGILTIEDRIIDIAHTAFTLHAFDIVFAIGRIGRRSIVVIRRALRIDEEGVVELGVIKNGCRSARIETLVADRISIYHRCSLHTLQ